MSLGKLISVAFACLFVGCANPPSISIHGNFVNNAEANYEQLVASATQQLKELYPPAKTRFELQQYTPDALGKGLVLALREAGYAVLEFDGVTNTPEGFPLRYTFDQSASDLYRLTLFVGRQSITRPFFSQRGVYTPVGYWTLKE
jgi:hypothetical protein